MTVWKYPLEFAETQSIAMPFGAEILTVQVLNGVPCLWALVDPQRPTEQVLVRSVVTGHAFDPIGEYLEFLGTYQIHGNALIFHVFASRTQ